MNKIKVKRIMMDFTQADMSEKLGIPQGLYSRKENGKVKFTLEEGLKLSEILDTDIKELFE